MPLLSEKEIQDIDELIKTGQAREAEKRLLVLKRSKIPRHLLAQAASLCRRSGHSSFAIKLLNPIVRPNAKTRYEATEREKAEYAAGLVRVGAVKEALDILQTIDHQKLPEVLLFEAVGRFSLWQYAQSIPILEKYIAAEKLSKYQSVVGKVNLAIAYFFERKYDQGRNALEPILEETLQENWKLLHGSALRILAQIEVGSQQWGKAQAYLARAEQTLRDFGGLDAFFVRKWQIVENLLRSGPTRSAVAQILILKKESIERQHWETLRSCDYYLAITQKDAKLAKHLYFGSPYDHIRQGIQREVPEVEMPSEYVLQLGDGSGPILDLLSGMKNPAGGKLKVGQLRHRLLRVLLSDFYQPFRLAYLYGELFPKEYFNPVSSPQRVYQAVYQLKRWFQTSQVPLEIEESKHNYRLVSKGCQLRIPNPNVKKDRVLFDLERVQEGLPVEFRAQEVSRLLEISPRSALTLLQDAHRRGILERLGGGCKTRYRFSVGKGVEDLRREAA